MERMAERGLRLRWLDKQSSRECLDKVYNLCIGRCGSVRSSVDDTRGQAGGHYRRLNRNVVSQYEEDNRKPL